MKGKSLLIPLFGASVFSTMPMAQTTEPPEDTSGIEQITVTAQRSSENIQSVAVPIDAATAM